jgi:hypothetical protein
MRSRFDLDRAVVLALLIVALLSPGSLNPAQAPDEGTSSEITGRLEDSHGIPILYLWGSPRERGFAHGWLLAEQIYEEAEEAFSMILGGNAEAYSSVLLPLVSAGFSFSNAEAAELEGLLEGIEQRLPGRKIEALGRPMILGDIKAINTYGDWYALGCSSAAVWGKLTVDQKPAVVRNFDFMPLGSLAGSQHLRVVAPGPRETRRGWVGISFPGSIGCVTAMSQEGVFASIHDVWVKPTAKDYIQRNVPRLIALRRIVEGVPAAGAVEKATELCRSWSTLFGNNFLVATPDTAAGLPAGVIEYDTREDRERGATLRAPDASASETPLSFVACSNGHRRRGTDSCNRYDSLVRGCRERQADPFDLPALVELVSSAAVPAPGKPVNGAFVGTLHQLVGFTGERRLWVRLLESREENIRDAKGLEVDVEALLAKIPGASQVGK